MKFVNVNENRCFRAVILWEKYEENPEENKGDYKYFSLLELLESDIDGHDDTITIDDTVCEYSTIQQAIL